MQKRLVRKIDLEMFLQQVKEHPTPDPGLEQYTIPVNIAATILHIAAYTFNDIIDKTVLDLGCGTGRLALGAAFIGAKEVVGVDISRSAVDVAHENSQRHGLEDRSQWLVSDIENVRGRFDSVLQNPPFGVQTRKADRYFLEKAMEIGTRIYTLHKSVQRQSYLKSRLKNSKFISIPPSPFMESLVKRKQGRIRSVFAMLMTIPYMFNFHSKRRHHFVTELYVIDNKSDD
ncbi:MAG: METTL5 family protein [Candidatus Bathyarchaeota archaeon]|jgi:putative methylase